MPLALSQVIVDFTATWCGPCRVIGPEFVALSTQFPSILFLKVDVDDVQVCLTALQYPESETSNGRLNLATVGIQATRICVCSLDM